MSFTHEWLAAVFKSGGHTEPPLDPQIPAYYLQKPRRQHSASAQSQLSPNNRRTSLAEIDLPSPSHFQKRQRVPNETNSTSAMSQPPQPPSRSSIRISARKADSGKKLQSVECVLDPDATPRPGRSGPAAPVHAPALQETNMPELGPTTSASDPPYMYKEDLDQPLSSISSVTGSTGSKARSRSPTKRMIDIKIAEKTVSSRTVTSPADVPEDVRKLYKEVQSLARVPRGVIPLGVEELIQTDAGGDLDDLDVFVATEQIGMSREELLDEFKVLRGVRDSTAFCKTHHLHEPSWNERVHCRMLEQAVRTCSGIEYHNITTARVIKELVPNNKYGEILKQKMIDYAITLGPPLLSENQVLKRLAASPRPLHRTINPSDYLPLCYDPIAISIETKSPNGGKESGEVQLSIWVMAYFNRLRTLTQNPVSITLPLILVSDEHWKLMFASDLEGEIRIIDAVDFGTTADIIGCYAILKVLKLVVSWAEGTFLEWFRERVLMPE